MGYDMAEGGIGKGAADNAGRGGVNSRGGGVAFGDGVVTQGAGGRFVRGASALSEKEAAFVAAYLTNGGHGSKAAEVAGYASPHTESWRLFQRPHIRDEIARAVSGQEMGLRALSLAALRRVLEDKGQPGTVTVAAAREAREAADRLRAIGEDMARRNGVDPGASIPDGVPDGAGGFDWRALLTSLGADPATLATQATDKAQ